MAILNTLISKLFGIRYILFAFFIILFSINSCNTTEPPPPQGEKGSLTITLIDTSCTEAWVDLKTQNISTPAEINLLLDDSALTNINLTTSDTVIYIDSLLPNKSYLLQASYTNNNDTASSNKLSITTLDTTSNNFSFSTFTFGDPSVGSSSLLDCAVISENDVWCVGEINIADTSINGYTTYNAVHWDGSNWTLIRIPYYYQGQPYYNPIQTVFNFGSNDVWFAGNGVIHWDGSQYDPVPLPANIWGQDEINKIWGLNSNDLYLIGATGSIAHYYNITWSKIESGTTTDINDIWGVNDSTANNSLVLCTVSSRFHSGDYKLLSISGNTAKEYISWPYTRIYGVWFNSPRKIYIVGDGGYLYVNNKLSRLDLPVNVFLTRVQGTGLNDIYMAGDFNTLLHYNGIRWKAIQQGMNGNYEGLDVKGNKVFIVGYNVVGGIAGNAVVTMGNHYK